MVDPKNPSTSTRTAACRGNGGECGSRFTEFGQVLGVLDDFAAADLSDREAAR
jgi:hypothetical protein